VPQDLEHFVNAENAETMQLFGFNGFVMQRLALTQSDSLHALLPKPFVLSCSCWAFFVLIVKHVAGSALNLDFDHLCLPSTTTLNWTPLPQPPLESSRPTHAENMSNFFLNG